MAIRPGRRRRWVSAAVLAVAAAGLSGPPVAGLAPALAAAEGIDRLPGWSLQGRLDDWLRAWQRSCERRPWQGQTLADGEIWRSVCKAAAKRQSIDAAWIARHFRVAGTADRALVTGYFEPSLRASATRSAVFATPLHRPPSQPALARLPRAAIDGGALAGRGLELAWLADPVAAFFLHIQGSGRLRFPDGRVARIGYAGNNGHAYRAIGRDLVEAGAIAREAVSMQSIASWLRGHPAEAAAMMQRNPRYIYFRWLETDGPVGAQGAVLTPRRSLAVDPVHIPYGLPVWLDVEHPDPAAGRLQHLTVAQDTGSAIKGPARADYFWGAGARAADLAGRMQSQGRLYILLPREAVSPLPRRRPPH